MRKSLDLLFTVSAFSSAFFLVAIVGLILARSLGRLVGIAIHDANELAGFCLAAGSFLALGPALRAGSHIRVSLVTSYLSAHVRRIVETITLVFAAFLAGYFTWWMGVLARESREFGESSLGVLAFPLWIPQAAMAFGLGVLTIAIVEELVQSVIRPTEAPAESVTTGTTE